VARAAVARGRGDQERAWKTKKLVMSDGSRSPKLDLRPLFEQFLIETDR
jgi:hypothetical protein